MHRTHLRGSGKNLGLALAAALALSPAAALAEELGRPGENLLLEAQLVQPGLELARLSLPEAEAGTYVALASDSFEPGVSISSPGEHFVSEVRLENEGPELVEPTESVDTVQSSDTAETAAASGVTLETGSGEMSGLQALELRVDKVDIDRAEGTIVLDINVRNPSGEDVALDSRTFVLRDQQGNSFDVVVPRGDIDLPNSDSLAVDEQGVLHLTSGGAATMALTFHGRIPMLDGTLALVVGEADDSRILLQDIPMHDWTASASSDVLVGELGR